MNMEHWWKGTDRRKLKYLNKNLHQCHLSATNVKLQSELEPETLRSTFCDWPYEPQRKGIFRNYVMCGISRNFKSVVMLAMKRN